MPCRRISSGMEGSQQYNTNKALQMKTVVRSKSTSPMCLKRAISRKLTICTWFVISSHFCLRGSEITSSPVQEWPPIRDVRRQGNHPHCDRIHHKEHPGWPDRTKFREQGCIDDLQQVSAIKLYISDCTRMSIDYSSVPKLGEVSLLVPSNLVGLCAKPFHIMFCQVWWGIYLRVQAYQCLIPITVCTQLA